MDLSEFEVALRDVRPGQYANVPYEIFELLFPPGVKDDDAKGAAYAYARARGFRIENRPDRHEVWFVRDAEADVWEPEVLDQTGDYSWITVAAPFEMARDSRELIGQPVRVRGVVHRIVGIRNDVEPREERIPQGEKIRLWLRPPSEDKA
jgi:hypothetical protein